MLEGVRDRSSEFELQRSEARAQPRLRAGRAHPSSDRQRHEAGAVACRRRHLVADASLFARYARHPAGEPGGPRSGPRILGLSGCRGVPPGFSRRQGRPVLGALHGEAQPEREGVRGLRACAVPALALVGAYAQPDGRPHGGLAGEPVPHGAAGIRGGRALGARLQRARSGEDRGLRGANRVLSIRRPGDPGRARAAAWRGGRRRRTAGGLCRRPPHLPLWPHPQTGLAYTRKASQFWRGETGHLVAPNFDKWPIS